MMTNKLYDKLKFCATTAIPAVVTAWLTIGTIWRIPYAEPIGATITALNVCLGVCLGVSSKVYNGETTKEDGAK